MHQWYDNVAEHFCFSIFIHFFISVGDGRQGYPKKSPYNIIHVGLAAANVPQSVSTLMHEKIFFFYSLKTIKNYSKFNFIKY